MNFSCKSKMHGANFISSLLLALLAACGGGNDSSSTMPLPPQALATTVVVAPDYTTIVQQLYISYFGRPADTEGLANFKSQLAALGGPTDIQKLDQAYRGNVGIKSLVDSFGTSAESAALYSGDNIAFVTAIYKNVLNRTPDAAGLAFWVGALNNGILTRANASLSIMAGALANATAQGKLDGSLINQKVIIGSNFTNELVKAPVNGYRGNAAAALARAMLTSVTATTDPAVFQATVIMVVNNLAGTLTNPIKSQIDGNFFGWSGDNIFKLTNGQFWHQSSYAYLYSYKFRPMISILPINGGFELQVEGIDQGIKVDQLFNTIKSQIDSDFSGWSGQTIFKLTNGQIWQQSSYAYIYNYQYRPMVSIFSINGGFELQVDGIDQRVKVNRLL